MKKTILAILTILLINKIEAQVNYGKEWVTGGGISYKINFANTGIINTYLDTFYSPYFTEGNSNICDTSGNLILCSDGFNVYDSNANYIDGGDTLIPNYYYTEQNGWSFASQSSIFLPMDSSKYYFITPTFSDSAYYECHVNSGSCFFDLLLYNVIDMKANGGAGKVVKRMQPIMQNAQLSKTQMMACRHANGKDWWLLKQGGDSNIVYKFLFTQDSVYDFGRQVFNEPLFGAWDLEGQSVFNYDGSKYATTVKSFQSTGLVSIFDFDRCYGKLSNLKVIHAPEIVFPIDSITNGLDALTTGLAYSPNGRFLYVALQYDIYQYDTQDTTWYLVAGIDTTFTQFQNYTTIYLAPDSKLYIGNFNGLSKQMSRIDNPDVKGAGCNFCPRCLRLDSVFHYGGAGTPPCMPNYSLGAKVCFPDGATEVQKAANNILLYPNPANTQLNIKYNSAFDTRLQIVDMLGIVIKEIFLSKTTQTVAINVNDMMSGVYVYKQLEGKKILNTGKLIINN